MHFTDRMPFAGRTGRQRLTAPGSKLIVALTFLQRKPVTIHIHNGYMHAFAFLKSNKTYRDLLTISQAIQYIFKIIQVIWF